MALTMPTALWRRQIRGGNIKLSYAQPKFTDNDPKANTQSVEFKVTHGAVTHYNNGHTDFFGINFDNAKAVSGETYNVRGELKDRGFKWDGKTKSWVKN